MTSHNMEENPEWIYTTGAKHEDLGVSAYPPKIAMNALYGKRHETNLCTCVAINGELTCTCNTSDTGTVKPEDNPLSALRVERPQEPTTIEGYVEWLTLRTASLPRWVAAEEKDLLLETLKRMESDIRGIRTLLNSNPEVQSATDPIDPAGEFWNAKPKGKRVKRWSPFI